MSMKEVEIDYKTLFAIIEAEENASYKLNEEYFQSTPIQIQDENGEWIDVNGLIKKEDHVIELELGVDDTIICAETHLIMMYDKTLKYVRDLELADRVMNLNKECTGIVTNITKKGEKQVVYDMEVNSKTHLYQIANGTIHHNTLLTSAIVKYANMLNMRTITIVPSSSLLKQTHDYIKQFDIPVGMFGGGKKDDEPNMVCTWQTLQNNKPFIRDFECIIWDECIHPSSLVRMYDNSEKRIDELQVGEMVKTINEKTKQIENKPVKKIHKNLLKSQKQKMFRITMEDGSNIELTGNHEVLTDIGWKRTDSLTIDDNIISLAEQMDYHLIELYLKKRFNKTISEWFNVTPTTVSRWKKIMPNKYIDHFKHRTNLNCIDDLIKEIY